MTLPHGFLPGAPPNDGRAVVLVADSLPISDFAAVVRLSNRPAIGPKWRIISTETGDMAPLRWHPMTEWPAAWGFAPWPERLGEP